MKKNTTFLEEIMQLNEGNELHKALEISLNRINALNLVQLNKIGLRTYQEDKWTVHQIIQHLIDWERIWCIRAILFARQEGSIPEAYDQEIMGNNSNANERPLDHLIGEMRTLRQSTIMMFESYNKDILETNCVFFEYEMPLYALGLAITAHQIHHFKVIEEWYLPLVY